MFYISAKPDAYIGLEYTTEEVLIELATGSPFEYENWGTDQPAAPGCVYLAAFVGTWFTDDCSTKDSILCYTVGEGGEY